MQRRRFLHGKTQSQVPLSDITVLDFTWVLAGPHASKTLADMGANVIKVEQYKAGANERWLPLRITKNDVTQSSYTITVNRGKRSICVNMKTPKGMKLIQELIKKSDVLLENFAPGVMDRLKLDYDSVKKIKKDIIYCSISCFGHWGPYSHKPGYDMIAQGASGWTGQSDPPIIAPVSIGDTTASMHACTAILAALHHRTKTGVGQNIDISMMDCLFSLHENTLPWFMISEAAGNPIKPAKIGQKHPGYAPYGIYKGKNGFICIACLTEARWVPLVELMGREIRLVEDGPPRGNGLHALLDGKRPHDPRGTGRVGHVAGFGGRSRAPAGESGGSLPARPRHRRAGHGGPADQGPRDDRHRRSALPRPHEDVRQPAEILRDPFGHSGLWALPGRSTMTTCCRIHSG